MPDLVKQIENKNLISMQNNDLQDVGEDEDSIQKKIHSTPRVIQCPVRAMSSTPNHDSFSNRMARNVCTQTTFTLTTMDQFRDDLKPYCTEIPDERRVFVSCKGSSKKMSPLSRCRNKHVINSEETPVRATTRKLSLRSKTMICSALGKTKDKPNAFARYKSLEEKRVFSNTFSTLPHPKTPPQTERILHNPFEAALTERLGKTILSPTVFDNVLSPSEDSDYLRWTIEDLSSINPVAIEEDFSFPPDDEDPERESQVQREIDRYFSETHVVLSPYDDVQSTSFSKSEIIKLHARAAASTPQKLKTSSSIELKNATTQTALTLPEVLPAELEKSLTSYFKCFEEDELNLSASNLRRKLFFHSEDEPPSPVRFEICSSPVTDGSWDVENSPNSMSQNKRLFTPPIHRQELSSPELSPVAYTTSQKKTSIKKNLHEYFTDESPHTKKQIKTNLFVGPVENSTVITSSVCEPNDSMCVDSDGTSGASSVPPSSQDTGYNSEESLKRGF